MNNVSIKLVLSDQEIWMEIGSGRLSFSPRITTQQVSPSAVDLRLSNQSTVFKTPPAGATTTIDFAKAVNIEEIAGTYGDTRELQEGEAFELNPKMFALAYTLEYIKMPNYLTARVEGRSSLARLGISIHQTAPTVHATFEGQLRLEILNNGPYICKIYPNTKICQLVIERLGSPSLSTLRSPFQQQNQG